MDGVKFESVRQVEDLYENIIEMYNDVLVEYEELEMIDDDVQELRNTMLDKYDYSLMAEVYRSLGENDTAEELDEKANECQEIVEELQKKLDGIDIKEHLLKFYETEIKKENFDIQVKACEKFLEKNNRRREAEKLKGNIRPASPRRFPNLTRVPSPRFISDSSDEDTSDFEDFSSSSSEDEKEEKKVEKKETKSKKKETTVAPKIAPIAVPAPAPAPAPAPVDKSVKNKKTSSKPAPKLNLLPVPESSKETEKKPVETLPLPPPPASTENKKKKKGK